MRPFSRPSAHRGIALVTSLLMLVVVTLLALSMFRSLTLQEKIAGNTREKQRSLQTAESALQYAEWWIKSNPTTAISTGTNTTCSGNHYNANVVSNIVACNNPLPSNAAASLAWPGAGDYTPPSMTVAAGGGVVSAGGDINYTSPSSLYIQYLGLNGSTYLFLITAVGYGGSVNGASVFQSTYSLTFTGSGSGTAAAVAATGFTTQH